MEQNLRLSGGRGPQQKLATNLIVKAQGNGHPNRRSGIPPSKERRKRLEGITGDLNDQTIVVRSLIWRGHIHHRRRQSEGGCGSIRRRDWMRIQIGSASWRERA